MANLYNEGDAHLAPFLRELADSIDSNKLQQDQLKSIGEFYMNYKMNDEIFNNTTSEENNFEDMDIIRFLTMGWYIYTQLLKNNTTSNPTGPCCEPNTPSAENMNEPD